MNIFQLSINHLKKPKNAKYAYLVFPNITEEKLNDYFKNPPVKILENSKNIQAVQQINSNITEIVFYNADSITINSDLKISSDKPAILLLEEKDNQLIMSIADPNQNQEKIVITVNTKLKDKTNIVFTLPQGIYLGKSVKSKVRFPLAE